MNSENECGLLPDICQARNLQVFAAIFGWWWRWTCRSFPGGLFKQCQFELSTRIKNQIGQDMGYLKQKLDTCILAVSFTSTENLRGCEDDSDLWSTSLWCSVHDSFLIKLPLMTTSSRDQGWRRHQEYGFLKMCGNQKGRSQGCTFSVKSWQKPNQAVTRQGHCRSCAT